MVSALRSKVRNVRGRLQSMAKNALAPNLYRFASKERIGSAFMAPSDMELIDRIMLYALVRGLRPTNILEIGIRYGGGARIIASALADNGHGQAIGVDPAPQSFRVPVRQLHGRYVRHEGYSPEAIPDAVKKLSGKIDLVLIDALHTGDAVYADFHGALPFLSDSAHVLFHDAYHQGIAAAIDQIVGEHPDFHDLGVLTRRPQMHYPVCYQGLRVIRKGKDTDSANLINGAYWSDGREPPPFHTAFRNFDEFANSIGKGADLAEVERVMATVGSSKHAPRNI